MQKRERRHKLRIYYDILNAIQQEGTYDGGAKPTRVQHLSNLPYDRLTHYLNELESKKMINKSDSLSLTEVGLKFLKDYAELRKLYRKNGS